MNKVLKHELLHVVMKIMKYSMQPALFQEPLENFLDVFHNLDFLNFNNLTKFGGSKYRYLNKKMNQNWNPRIFMCQYGRQPIEMSVDGNLQCDPDLFHTSMTNGGFGYTFNQADYWDLYSSTWYTKEFAKIYRPKGFQKYDSEINLNRKEIKDGWIHLKNNIFYPVQSGPENGLTVRDLITYSYCSACSA